jgi:hypothetical protein
VGSTIDIRTAAPVTGRRSRKIGTGHRFIVIATATYVGTADGRIHTTNSGVNASIVTVRTDIKITSTGVAVAVADRIVITRSAAATTRVIVITTQITTSTTFIHGIAVHHSPASASAASSYSACGGAMKRMVITIDGRNSPMMMTQTEHITGIVHGIVCIHHGMR